MTAIPEDIIQAAREAVASVWEESGAWVKRLVRCVRLGEKDGTMSVQIATRAILAERERCISAIDEHIRTAVKIAVKSAVKAERELCALVIEDELVEIFEDSPDIDIECNNLCRRAASAIRSSPPTATNCPQLASNAIRSQKDAG